MSKFTFRNFSNISQLTLNEGATKAGKNLRLVNDYWQSGSAFYNKPITLKNNTSFNSYFQFKIHGLDGTDGGDGFAFMLQNDPQKSQAVGELGSYLGFFGIDKGVAIEFDSVDYYGDEIGDNHIGINLSNQSEVSSFRNSKNTTYDLNSGKVLNAWVDYDGTTDKLNVFLSDKTNKPAKPLLSKTINIPDRVGSQAYVGFSAGTGSLANNHDILKWNFSEGNKNNSSSKTIKGTAKDDAHTGTSKDDIIDGQAGDDLLIGNNGKDKLSGGKSWDLLQGNTGNDTLLGNGNSDVLVGGNGRDILTGGPDSDVFFLVPETKKKAQADRITDFDKATDFIVLGNNLTSSYIATSDPVANVNFLGSGSGWSGLPAQAIPVHDQNDNFWTKWLS